MTFLFVLCINAREVISDLCGVIERQSDAVCSLFRGAEASVSVETANRSCQLNVSELTHV